MWGLRAYVLARKGVLASSPDVKNMTRTQWVLEYHALKERDRLYIDSFTKITKSLLVSTLGLNLIRPIDENGNPKQLDKMTDEERDAYIPLSAWCARPEMLKTAYEQMEKDIDPGTVTSDKQYEELVAAIDANDGDMVPILGLDKIDIPQDPKTEQQKKMLDVKDISEMSVDVDGDI